MPNKKIPLSYQFLTDMMARVHPDFLGWGRWESPPYTESMMKVLLSGKDKDGRSTGIERDLIRTPWLFGSIKDKKEKEEKAEPVHVSDENNFINELKEAAKNAQDPIDLTEKKDKAGPFQVLDENNFINELKEAAKNAQDPIDLTELESKALWSFSQSIGEAVFQQGGSIQGLPENCFLTFWMERHYQLTKGSIKYNNYEAEANRIQRLPDKKIMVSSFVKGFSVFDMWDENDAQLIEASEGDTPYIYQFSCEQIIEESINDNGETIFTLKPHHQECLMQETFWKKRMVPFAQEHLGKLVDSNRSFTDSDFFVLVPCVCDEDFRKDLAQALAKRPSKEYNTACDEIRKCYKGQGMDEELDAVLNQLNHEREDLAQALAKRPRKEYNTACDEIRKCYKDQGMDKELKAVLNKLNHERAKATKAALKKPAKLALGAGVILAVLGATLAATGVLAPLGVALGWAGLTLAAPSAAAAVGGICLVLPTVLGSIAGLVTKFKDLVNLFSSPSSSSEADEKQYNINIHRALEEGLIRQIHNFDRNKLKKVVAKEEVDGEIAAEEKEKPTTDKSVVREDNNLGVDDRLPELKTDPLFESEVKVDTDEHQTPKTP